MDRYIDKLIGKPYAGGAGNAGTVGAPWRDLYDITDYEDTTGFPVAEDVNINLTGSDEYRETLTFPHTVDATYTTTVRTDTDDSTRAIIRASDPAGGFLLGPELGAEKLTDGGFEIWTNPNTLTNWTTIGAVSGTVAREATAVQKGNYSASLQIDAAAVFGIQQANITLAWNTDFRLSVMVRTGNATDRLAVYIRRFVGPAYEYLLADGTWVIPGLPIPLDMTGTLVDTFHKYTVGFDTGADTGADETNYQVQFVMYDTVAGYPTGEAYLDNASLREVANPDNAVLNWDFENWAGAGDAEEWVETAAGGSTITEETTDVYTGSSCVDMFIDAIGSQCTIRQNTVPVATTGTWRFSFAHKEHLGAVAAQTPRMKAYIMVGVNYLTTAGGLTAVMAEAEVIIDRSVDWKVDHVDYTISAAPFNCTLVVHADETVGLGCNHFLDRVTFGKANVDNLETIKDPNLRYWGTDDDQLAYYDHLDKYTNEDYDYAYVKQGEMPRLNSENSGGAELRLWQAEAAGFVQTTTLDTSTDYRAQVFINTHKHKSNAYNSVPIILQIAKNYGTVGEEYWNPATQTFEVAANGIDAASGYSVNWDLISAEFTTDPSGTLYSVIVKVDELIDNRKFNNHRIFVDEVSIEEISDDDYYWTYFDWPDQTGAPPWSPIGVGDPAHVYVSGIIRGVAADKYHLHKEEVFTDHPRKWAWSYDSVTRILYMNIGEDPGDMTVDVAVRNRCIDTNQESRCTASNLTLKDTIKDCAWAHEGDASRPQEIEFNYLYIYDAGAAGINSGYVNFSDWTANRWLKYTVKDFTVDHCYIYRPNRCAITNRGLLGGNYSGSSSAQYFTMSSISVQAGIDYSGSYDGTAAGAQIITHCYVRDTRPLIDSDHYGNCIYVGNGEYATIQYNEVTRGNHGIVVIGHQNGVSDGFGVCMGFDISYNNSHDTGDDNCWLAGITGSAANTCRVAHNIFNRSFDNGLELDNCAFIEVHNNLIHDSFNENIAVYNLTGTAWIFNNIISYWGGYRDDSVEGAVQVGRGAAIGYYIALSESFIDDIVTACFIDNNIYYHDPNDLGSKDTMFHVGYRIGGVNYNTHYTSEAWREMFKNDNTSIFFQEPRFENLSASNFALKYDSPAIDKGLLPNTVHESIGGVWFNSEDAPISLLDPGSVWPEAVRLVDGTTIGPNNVTECGPYAYVTDNNILVVTDAAGAAQVGAVIGFDMYSTATGHMIAEVPTAYEIGNGMYAFSTRVTQSITIQIDCDDDGALGLAPAEKYKYFEVIPDTEYLKRLTDDLSAISDIKVDTSAILDIVTQSAEDMSEALGLLFKNSVRRDRKYDDVDGEMKLTSEYLDVYDRPPNDAGATVIATYAVTYSHLAGEVNEMKFWKLVI